MKGIPTISDKEEIARILHREWIVDNTLQINAANVNFRVPA